MGVGMWWWGLAGWDVGGETEVRRGWTVLRCYDVPQWTPWLCVCVCGCWLLDLPSPISPIYNYPTSQKPRASPLATCISHRWEIGNSWTCTRVTGPPSYQTSPHDSRWPDVVCDPMTRIMSVEPVHRTEHSVSTCHNAASPAALQGRRFAHFFLSFHSPRSLSHYTPSLIISSPG